MTWIWYALLSALSAALVAIFGKIGISKVDTTLATAIRAVMMAGILVIAAALLGKFAHLKTIDNKAFLFITLSGIAGAASWMWYFLALKTGPAHGVAALDRLSVVFVLVLAALFLGEALTWKTALGGILVTLGALLLVF